jgi:hypothetical protein
LSVFLAGRALRPEISSDTHFCYRLSKSRGHGELEGLGALEKISNLIGNRTRDLRAGSIAPQPSILQLILQVINTTINKQIKHIMH